MKDPTVTIALIQGVVTIVMLIIGKLLAQRIDAVHTLVNAHASAQDAEIKALNDAKTALQVANATLMHALVPPVPHVPPSS